jgi:hypothetical protein
MLIQPCSRQRLLINIPRIRLTVSKLWADNQTAAAAVARPTLPIDPMTSHMKMIPLQTGLPERISIQHQSL